jgi:RNA polymerase sigma factor (sigma-70 family)
MERGGGERLGRDYSQTPDSVLLRRVAEQDREALGEIYERHALHVFNFAMRLVQRRDRAEEVLQEVFLKVLTKADRYNPAYGEVRSWILRITRNTAVDILRKIRNEGSDHLDHIQDERPGVESQAIAHDEQSQVRRAVAGLPQEQRQVLECLYYRGMTQAETAAVLGVPLGTVKGRARLAIKKLHTLLNKGEERRATGDQV